MLGLHLIRRLSPQSRERLLALAAALPEDCFRVVVDACVREWLCGSSECNLEALKRHFGLAYVLPTFETTFMVATTGPKSRALLRRESLNQITMGCDDVLSGVTVYRLGTHLRLVDFAKFNWWEEEKKE